MIFRLAYRGDLPALRLGTDRGPWRFRQETVESMEAQARDFVSSGCQTEAAPFMLRRYPWIRKAWERFRCEGRGESMDRFHQLRSVPAGEKPPTPGASQNILTVRESASLLRLGEKGLRKLVLRGEIPAFRISSSPRSQLRFRRSRLEAWIKTREWELRREVESV